MTTEHHTLKQRFLRGDPMTKAEVMRLCQLEQNRWPLTLWEEEQALSVKAAVEHTVNAVLKGETV
jgi:hypothetical protein